MSEIGHYGMENGETMLSTQVKTYPEGVGAVCPTGEVSDIELLNAVRDNQAEIQDPAKVCIDEREALEAQPVRAKMAGGNLTTGFVAAELADWHLYTDEHKTASVAERVDVVADHLVGAGEVLGAHVDNHAEGDKSNCGAADGMPNHTNVIATHGLDEQFVGQMHDALGENFDESTWNSIVSSAQEKLAQNGFEGWSGMVIIKAVEARDGVVEVLNGDNNHPEKDPENKRHNHWAEGVALNTESGKSNNRDTARIPHFQVDAPALIETCQRMASNNEEFSRLLHAAVGFQFAVRYNLTSQQRNVTV